jgi:hypothetical protein
MSDITKHEFEPNSFDVVYSRDTILHIGDKEALFSKFFVRRGICKFIIELAVANNFPFLEMAETGWKAHDQ